ncbi:translocating chain-associated membrane protein 1-like 1 isoform X2 [Convolutriloba macropyga]|uniref:translocating chain-associated membrane protein 1-like 1 isoform X2 n=1 Tax=Convolutriloba macropyga TaxID=536237 RepID=UPI003F52176C
MCFRFCIMVQKKKSSKAATFPSHEFFIQNHGDIAVTIMVLFFIGMVFQPTNHMASKVLFLNYNISTENISILHERPHTFNYFVSGPLDWCNILYYSVGCIVAHALIQEYLLDKLLKKSHLSKSKLSKFNESAQLGIFYAVSLALVGYIFYMEKFPLSISFLWDDYPHKYHVLHQKFFFIAQIAYWIHIFPEIYFQKVRKEDMPQQITYSSLYLVFLTAAYFLNFSRLAMLLISVHYAVEILFHVARFLKIVEKEEVAKIVFCIWAFCFVMGRLLTFLCAFLTFWVGLSKTEIKVMDIKSGNFNTSAVRLVCLVGVFGLQTWLMWNFIQFQLKYIRDRQIGREAQDRLAFAEGELIDSSEEGAEGNTQPNTAENTPKKTRKNKSNGYTTGTQNGVSSPIQSNQLRSRGNQSTSAKVK